jgi:hypothetical protein
VDSEYGKGSTFWLELPFQLKRGSVSEPTTDSYPSTTTYIGSPLTLAKGQMVDNVITEAPGAIGLAPPLADPASPDPTHQEHVRTISDSTMADSIPMPCTPRTPQHPAVAPINVLVVDDDQ